MTDAATIREIRIKAARKAAATRRINKARMEYYMKATLPAMHNIDALLHLLIAEHEGIRVYWSGDHRLRKGADSGILLKTFDGGKLWKVLIDGYKNPQTFHASYWRTK